MEVYVIKAKKLLISCEENKSCNDFIGETIMNSLKLNFK